MTEPAPTPEPAPAKSGLLTKDNLAKGAGVLAAGAGVTGLVFAGMMGYQALTTPDVEVNTPTTPTTPTTVDVEAGDEDKALTLLRTQGLNAPKTPLGERLLEAMQKDPEFRVRIMRDAEGILKQ